MRTLALAALVSTAALAAPAAVAQQPRLTIGVIDPGGVIVPFAAFDGSAWVDPWFRLDPGEDALGTTPPFWRSRDAAVPRRWFVWARGSKTPAPATVLSPVKFDAHCQEQIGLQTDARLEKTEDPRHSQALALDREHRVVRALDFADGSTAPADWKDLIDEARRAFGGLEDAHLSAWEKSEGGRSFPVDRASRAARSITFSSLRAHRSGSSRTLYFEATRAYGAVLDPRMPASCGVSTVITGWIHAADGKPPVVSETRTGFSDCDGKFIITTHPLGIIEWQGSTLWLILDHGYEDVAYVIVQAGPAIRRLLTVAGGGC